MEHLDLSGRILYLAEDNEITKAQLVGQKLLAMPSLKNNISTDEIIPARFTTASVSASDLGRHLLRGLEAVDQIIGENGIINNNFKIIVAGENFGTGSSREHVQYALRGAGIKAVFAKSWGKIFGDNNLDWGIPTLKLNIPEVQAFLHKGTPINIEVYQKRLGPITRQIAESGGILEYTRRRMSGEINTPLPQKRTREMNSLEKIVAKTLGVNSVEPGEEYNLPWEFIYFYDLQGKDMQSAIEYLLSIGLQPKKPNKTKAFEDHLATLKHIKPKDQVSDAVREILRKMCTRLGIQDFEADPTKGAAICHTKMAEDFIEPGMAVVGNDSHTNSLGFMGALARANGATRTAVGIFTGDVVFEVPEVIKINLIGDRFPKGVHMKDLSLYLGSTRFFRDEKIAMGRAIFYDGPILKTLSADELFVGANMSRELLAEYGFFLPTINTLKWIERYRPGVHFELEAFNWLIPDKNAQYSHIITVDLRDLEPMVALPGDPQNAVPISKLAKQPEIADWIEEDGRVHINKVYAGSCMLTLESLRIMSEIIGGYKVHPSVEFYYQAASPKVFEQAVALGYIKKLDNAGAKFAPYGCGACFGSGPGATIKGDKALFCTNRNLPSRTGEETPLLANEEVGIVAAITGYICPPEDL